ncbi:uncharacterized protein LOC133903269 [Phragmites australis]|uniref:uncharacterized protein LOC133903269 n=1 Tax=Phragmites australis TaxID=29695 RepID=UPI002D770840|nr:uncharacterized protein LOC133903269 [Phragmites australis]
MPRRKVSNELIPNRRVRAATFAKRKEGLKKKARELATLCGVRVALVCGAAAEGVGGAAADVWQSEEGVLDTYRKLPPEERALHTHLGYAERELGKEAAKLARVRQGGPATLPAWDEALDDVVTMEEAQRLLRSVDEALRGANERRKALGLLVDDDGGGSGLLEGIVAPGALAGVDGYLLRAPGNVDQIMWDNGFQQRSAAMMQPGYGFQQCTSSSSVGMDGYHLQMKPDMYGNNGGGGRLARGAFQPLNSATIQRGYGLQSTRSSYAGMDGYYMQQGQGNGGVQLQPNLAMWSTDEPRNAATMQSGYGLQCTSSSYAGADGYPTQQVPDNGGAQPNMVMWSTNEPSDAIVPVVYPSLDIGLSYMDTDTPAAHATQGTGGRSLAMGAGGNFINAPPALSLTMGTGDNFASAPPAQPLATSYHGNLTNASGYTTQWPAQQLQRAGSGQESSLEQLHYLSDLEDKQVHLWGN